MNQQQRKYVRNRLEEAYALKRNQLRASLSSVTPAFKSIEERRKYVNDAIKGNPKIKSITISSYNAVGIVTDKDEEYNKRLAEARKVQEKKSQQLEKIYREAMDEVMLGDDAAALTAALSKIETFNID